MTTTTDRDDAETLAPTGSFERARRPRFALPRGRRGGRKPVRRFMIVTHRWLSLVLGLVLLLISTTGALLLYRPELVHVMNHAAYSPSGGPATVSYSQAFGTVETAHPGFKPTGVVLESGIYKVHNADYEEFWSVDPGTGKILGHIGKPPKWVELMDNFHECFFSCEGETGFVKVFNKAIPHTTWLGDEADITYGSLVLGIFGLLLLYLSLTGLWLWFPRPSQLKKSLSVRWRRGRFARDTDLHKVAGMIVLPAMVIWAVTGAGFELRPVEKAWYAVTPGHKLPEKPDPVSKKSKAPDIGIDAAVATAHTMFPADKVDSVDIPDPTDPTGVYYIWLGAGFDPYAKAEYPGDRAVVVDRHTGTGTVVYGSPSESTAQDLWDSWSYPVHSGYIVNGWWRLIWLALGLSPILLGVTGVSTWLVRRRTKKNRKKAAAAVASPVTSPVTSPVASAG